MAATSPDNISYPSNADAQKTIEQRIEDTAVSVQSALNTKAASSHVHSAGDVTSGNLAVAQGGTGVSTGVGLVPIIPSSVSVGSGSASVSTSGLVTFSGATSLSLNSVFTSSYSTYRIITTLSGSAAGAAIYMRLRASSSDSSTGSYFYTGNWQRHTNTSYLSWNGAGTTFFDLGRVQGSAAIISYIAMDITNPLASTRTNYTMSAQVDDNNSPMWINSGGIHVSSTSFDGFTIYPTSGNFTGTIQVYGYR
jgi:hypothetical protein